MGNSGYWNKMIIDLPQIEENKELFASHIDLEEEEKKLKEEAPGIYFAFPLTS